jgi:peroxiredoxin Q/BCP
MKMKKKMKKSKSKTSKKAKSAKPAKKAGKKSTKKSVKAKKSVSKSVKKSGAKSAKKSTAARKKPTLKSAPKKKSAPRAKKSVSNETSIPATDLETLMTGASAPNFNLPTDAGSNVSLDNFKGKTVILYFYPKDDTPGCTKESCDFRDSFARVQSKGAIVLGVSKDSVESHKKFKEKFSLPFPLVSDESGKMLEDYRVWKEKLNYGKKYMGIDRTTYVIDVDANGKGTIRKAYPKVKVDGHVEEILKDLG